VVLDSVIPVTVTLAKYWESTRAGFDSQACIADAGCNAAHPNLETTVTDLVNTLEAEPLTTTANDPVTGEQVTVVLDGGSLVDWIRDQSRTNTSLTRIPALLDELAQGNPEALAAIAMYKVQLSVVPAPGSPAASYGLERAWSAVSNSRRKRTYAKPVSRRFPSTLPRFGIRLSVRGHTSMMTV
jgi:hypothetical protein